MWEEWREFKGTLEEEEGKIKKEKEIRAGWNNGEQLLSSLALKWAANSCFDI